MDPITISGIITTLLSEQTVAGMIAGVFGSYAANHIPLLKRSPNFERSARLCFCDTAKEWGKMDFTRSSIYTCWLKSFEEFIDFLSWNHPNKELVVTELIPLWINKMRNHEDCRTVLVEFKVDLLLGITEKILKEQSENKEILQRIESYITRFKSKGTAKFKPVENYIQRSCDIIGTNVDFFRNFDGYQEKTLLDFVMKGGAEKNQSGKFILYSSMQTGKTTELEQLGWLLQESNLYQPVLISLSLVPDLKYEDLPEEDQLGMKPVVLLIDALDETREGSYCELIRRINNYVKHHQNMTIVMSSRSNFRTMGGPNCFTELELLPLRHEDICQYVEGKLKGEANELLHAIVEKDLFGLASVPLYLNTLINMFVRSKSLPVSTSELYDEIFESSYRVEEEKMLNDLHAITKQEEKCCMEKAAGMMLCIGRRELNEDEFRKILPYDKAIEYEHLRYDIIQKRDTKDGKLFVFKQNAMLEYMAACLLLCCKDFGALKKIVCYSGTDLLKDNWFSTMQLWMEMMVSNQQGMIDDVKAWLSDSCQELAIHAPERLLSDNERGWILIQILKQCKTGNTYFYGYGNNLIPKKRKLPKCLIEYLLNEWGGMKTIDAHLKNIHNLTRMIDWNYLYAIDSGLGDQMVEVLYSKLNDPLFENEASEWIYSAMANDFFYSPEHTSRLYGVVKDRTDIDTVEMMMARIAIQDHPEAYIDYIVKANNELLNKNDDHTYRSVYRESLYMAMSKMRVEDCPAKLLSILVSENYWRYSDDKVRAADICQRLVDEIKASECYHENKNELYSLITKIDDQKKLWTSPLFEMSPEESERRRKRGEAYEKEEISVLFDDELFKKQALNVINSQGEENELDVKVFFEHELLIGEGQEHVSRYVINYLLRFVSSEDMKMKRKDALDCINNEGMFIRYRLGEMGNHLTGGKVIVELSPEQKAICYQTASEVIRDMIVNSFDGRIYPHEQTSLSLLIQGKISVEKNREHCKGLLKYIGVDLERTIDMLFDDVRYSPLLEFLRSYVSKEEMLVLMFELATSIKPRGYDPNAYNLWMTTMLKERYTPAVAFIKDKLVNECHQHWLEWIPYLTKIDSEIEWMIAHAEKQVELMEGEHYGQANEYFVVEFAKEMIKKEAFFEWSRSILERLLPYVDAFNVKRCMGILFKAGSRKALEYLLSGGYPLEKDGNYDFNYGVIDDVPLLVELYEKSRNWGLFGPSYNSILLSLSNIAMQDEGTLKAVQDAVKSGISQFVGSGTYTPSKWADNLTLQYRSAHQYLPNADEALALIKSIAA